jgi:hypothetical protein
MASIERTAYPRFKPSLTANELQTLYCPTDDERALIATHARGEAQQRTLLTLLKCQQYLGDSRRDHQGGILASVYRLDCVWRTGAA